MSELKGMAAEAVLIELGKGLALSLTAFVTRQVLKAADKRYSLEDSPLLARAKSMLEQDLDKISEQISSLAQSKRYATKSYLENGILYLKKALAELEGEFRSGDNVMVPAEFIRKLPSHNEGLRKAMEWFHEAHKSATEVFGDKKNIPPLQRLEAMEVILFCQTLEHWEDPRLTTEAWTTSVRHIYEDTELILLIKANLKKESILNRPNESMRSTFGKLSAMFTQLEAYVAQKDIPINIRQLLLASIQRPQNLKEKYHYFHHPQGGAHSILSGLGFVIKVFSGGCRNICALPNDRVALIRDVEDGWKLETRDAVTSRFIGSMDIPGRPLDLISFGAALFVLKEGGTVQMTSSEGPKLSDSILSHIIDVLPNDHELSLPSKAYHRLCPVDQETFLAADRRPFRNLAIFSRNQNNPDPVVYQLETLLRELGSDVELVGCRWAGGSAVLLVLLVEHCRLEVVSLTVGGAVLERNTVGLSTSELGKASVLDWAWEDKGGLVILAAMRASDTDFLITVLDPGLTRILSEEHLTTTDKDLSSIVFSSNGVLCLADINDLC